jgi:hypothetical protein
VEFLAQCQEEPDVSRDHFVCVQSVVADTHGNLWVVDPAAPAAAFVVQGGPKLVRIDLNTNNVAQVIHFDETVALQGSYLNDVRFSLDGRHAYLTDARAKDALVVVDLQNDKARRVLDGHPSTQPEKDVVVKTNGQEFRRPDGRGVEFAADRSRVARLIWASLVKASNVFGSRQGAVLSFCGPVIQGGRSRRAALGSVNDARHHFGEHLPPQWGAGTPGTRGDQIGRIHRGFLSASPPMMQARRCVS